MRFPTVIATMCALLTASACSAGPPSRIPVYPAVVQAVLPHDEHAFTEGLYYEDGRLYESTGVPAHSDIRQEDPATGRVLHSVALDPSLFGEGIVHAGNRIVSLTWQTGIGFFWDPATFAKLGTFRYPGEGWALTKEPSGAIIMSDGTPDLRILDPVTMRRTGTIHVTADGRPVERLNEIEWVDGRILANVWHTDRIAVIRPADGRVVAWIDLSAEAAENASPEPEAVANGIAWDAQNRRLYVTGKFWPRLYQIKVPKLGI